jgi:hypothetical protein
MEKQRKDDQNPIRWVKSHPRTVVMVCVIALAIAAILKIAFSPVSEAAQSKNDQIRIAVANFMEGKYVPATAFPWYESGSIDVRGLESYFTSGVITREQANALRHFSVSLSRAEPPKAQK